LTDADSTTFQISGGTVMTLPELNQADYANFDVTGASLTVPMLTSYTGGGHFVTTTLSASGTDSLLSLPELATLSVSTAYAAAVQVESSSSGDIELPLLTQVEGSVSLTSTGADSVLNLAALQSLTGIGGSQSLAVTQGGVVNDPMLTTFANATITTDPTATLTVPANQTFLFPNSTTTVDTGTFVIQGGIDVQGIATLSVQGNLTINGQGALSASANSSLDVSGNLLGNTTSAAAFNPAGTVILDSANGTSNAPQLLEVMSQDLGNVAAGFTNNFAYNTLELTANTYVELVDQSANSPGNTPEALYVNKLIVPAGATLDLDGLNLYYKTEQINGTVIGGGATVTGEVFEDVNDSGALAGGDPGLVGWTVELTNTATSSIYTTTTGANGLFSLTGIPAGTYTLSQTIQSGYEQTAPTSPATYTLNIASGQTLSAENFGDYPTASISGTVFVDTNGNGVLDSGESGLSGWTVDLINSSQTTITTTSSANGQYSFTGLVPGIYTVQIVSQSGYVASSPSRVNVTDVNGRADTVNFGEFAPVTVSGEVFDDPTDSGTFNTGDSGLAGVTVELIQGSQVEETTSGSGGLFSFANIGPGSFTLELIAQAGWAATNSPVTITPTSGTNPSSVDLGERPIVTISGAVYNDVADSGVLSSSDPGLSGWTVTLLNSANQVIASTTTDSNGLYSFNNLAAGNYTVEDVLQTGYVQTTPAFGSFSIVAPSGGVFSGENFGVFQADQGPPVYTVNTTADSGVGSLRAAIGYANAYGGAITVDLEMGTGAQTIDLLSPLPAITAPVTIDGTMQPGYSNKPLIELDGANADAGATGLTIAGSGITVEGLIIVGFSGDGIDVTGSGNLIESSYIGVGSSGSTALGNSGAGIAILDGAADNTIGGTTAGAGNVIAGNSGDGIDVIDSTSNLIAGNWIGTNAVGTAALANGGDGIYVDTSATVTIGGTARGAQNQISGNTESGIEITDSTGTLVEGDLIGVNQAGTAAIGNGAAGVLVDNGSASTSIGAAVAGGRNFISGNAEGVLITGATTTTTLVAGDLIGTNVEGTGAVGNLMGGVVVAGGTGATIGEASSLAGNVISGNLGDGIDVDAAAANTSIEGDDIGTDQTGTKPLANSGSGVSLDATGVAIGAGGQGAGNVISANAQAGVSISGTATTGVVIAGNRIGTDYTGNVALGNGTFGVIVSGAPGVTIGGAAASDENIISANPTAGIGLYADTTGALIQNNLIGTGKNGAALGNGNGIQIDGGSSNNTIGGTTSGAGNTIANSTGIGVDIDATAGAGNTIRLNSIYSNTGLGIDLGGDGVTQNNSVPHTGPNHHENFPVLTAVASAGGVTTVAGTLNSTPGTTFAVDLYAISSINASGYGEGRYVLGSTFVTTDAAGNASFDVQFPNPVNGSRFVTATATDPSGNTSEFSKAFGFDIPPTAVIGFSTITVNAGTSTTFDGLNSADPSESPLTYTWSFGDGTTETGPEPSHTYLAVGTDTLTLTVNDGLGGINTATATVNVADVPPAFTPNSYAPPQTLTPPTPGDGFGASIATNYGDVAIGAPSGNNGAGVVYLYDGVTTANEAVTTYAYGSLIATFADPHPEAGDEFGASLAVVGNDLIVGAPGSSLFGPGDGVVYVFDANSEGATFGNLLATLSIPDAGALTNAHFGASVGATNTTIVVGAPGENDGIGEVDVFQGDTTQSNFGDLLLDVPNPTIQPGSDFGAAVAGDGSDLIIGAPGVSFGSSIGGVYLVDGTTGDVITKIANPDPSTMTGFGSAVAPVGSDILIGSPDDNNGAGAAYLYAPPATTGGSTLLTTFIQPDGGGGEFGFSVAGTQDTALIGAPGANLGTTNAGAAYVFDANPASPTFGQAIAAVQEPTPTSGDELGSAVGFDDGALVAGAAGAGAVDLYQASASIAISSTTTYATSSFNSVIVSATFVDANPTVPLVATIDWGDGSADSVVDLPIGSYAFAAPHDYTTDPQSRSYTIGVTLTDPYGESAYAETNVVIGNPNPAFAQPGLALSSSSIVEGNSVNVSGTIVDPAGSDSNTVTLEWGDGSTPTTIVLAVGQHTFSTSHTFAANPAGVESQLYTIIGSVTNQNGQVGYASNTIYVNKVAPNLTPADLSLSETTADVGDTITLTGQFTDTDAVSTYNVTIDWGDGSTQTSLSELEGQVIPSATPGLYTFTATHQYLTNPPGQLTGGSFAINVSVSDSVNIASADTQIVVNSVLPTAQIASAVDLAAGTITVTAKVMDPNPLATDTVAWTLTQNGIDIGTSSGTSYTFPIPDPLGLLVITATVTASDGRVGTESAQLVLIEQSNATVVMSPSGVTISVGGVVVSTTASAGADQVIALITGSNDYVDASALTIAAQLVSSGSNATLIGGGGDDVLVADTGANSLFGGTGDDTLVSNGGEDTLVGSLGNDFFQINPGQNPYLIGGSGTNTLDFSTAAQAINVNLAMESGQAQTIDSSNSQLTLMGKFNTFIGSPEGGNVTLNDDNDLVYAIAGDNTITGGSGKDSLVGGSGNDIIYATTGDATITGGSGHDSIVGGSGNDIIYATTGDTTITGGSGHDSIVGGSGNDIIYATTGDSTITGGSGHDSIVGGSGNDIIYATTGDSTITGGSGHDSIVGGSGNDIIYATTGDSTITGGSGHDSIVGGSGNDIIYATTGDNTITGGSGHDSIVGGSGNDIIYATTGDNTITGGKGHDTIIGGSGNDIIYATTGDNTITGGKGHDTIIGGSGNDIIYATTGDATITGGSGHDSIVGGSGNDIIYATTGDTSINVGTGRVTVVAGSGNDNIVGNTGPAVIYGGTGNVSLTGGAADETIVGGSGNDTIFGGSGNDSILGGSGNDLIDGGTGDDTITGGYGNDTITGGSGNDIIWGGAGNDSIVGGSGSDSINGGSGNDIIWGGLKSSTINGGAGNDTIIGGDGNDIIYGGSGNDSIVGGYGAESIVGGTGNDVLIAGNLSSTITGGSGDDLIQGGYGNDIIFGGSGDTTIAAGTGDDSIVGGTGDDVIYGGTGDSTISAGTGNATISGGGGSDVLEGGGPDSWLMFYGSTNMTLTNTTFSTTGGGMAPSVSSISGFKHAILAAGNGNFTLDASGFSGSAILQGGTGDDTLIGASGPDTLIGGSGNDSLVGGGGGDTFAFNANSSGSQTIVEPTIRSNQPIAGLDFSQAPAGISINLSQSSAQAVMPATLGDGALTLTLADPLAIDSVLGSSYDDTIVGNINDNTLIGGGGDDVIVGVGGNNLIEGSITRTIYLDFSTYELPGQHYYTQAERNAIQTQLTEDFGAFSYVFTQTQPQSGPYTPIYFNDPVLVGLEGGVATGIDWRDLYVSGTTTLSADGLNVIPADFAGVNVNNFLGGPGEPAATSVDFIGLSATIAAHELGHLSGLEHQDSFGPIGSGIYSGVSPDQYNPPYPGPIDADQTIFDIMASGASVNATLEDAINDPYLGERDAIAVAFGESGSPTNEDITPPESMTDAQPIALAPLVVPDTDLEGVNADKVFDVTAADVVGYLGETAGASNTDYYSFTAQAGTLINFQLMSEVLTRSVAPTGDAATDYNQAPFNTDLTVYNSSGQVIATNDDSFQDFDSSIIDLTLPTTGTYYVEVTSSPNSVSLGQPLTGDYELFMYTFAAGTSAAYSSTTAGLGDTLYAGSGDDTIVAGAGDDTIEGQPQDTVVSGSGAVNSLAANTSLDVSAGSNQTVLEGTSVTLTGSFVDPSTNDTEIEDWHVVASSGEAIADGTGSTFTFTPGNAATYTVTLTVIDPGIGWDSASAVVTSLDAPPVLTAPTESQTAFSGLSASIDLGTLAITGVGPFAGTVEWGDGQTSTLTPTSSGSLSLDHTYAAPGSYTISETVSEYAGGSTTASFEINVANASTSTMLQSSAPTEEYGQSVTFTATVTGQGTPTGQVSFYDGPVDSSDLIGTGTLSVVDGQDQASISTTALSVSGSPNSITAVYGGDSEHLGDTSNAVSQTVTPAPLTITANNESMSYGGAIPTLTVSYSGLVNGDTAATFAKAPNTAPTATTVPASSDVGSYAIAVAGASDPNYTITYADGTLTINPHAFTYTIANDSQTYGTAANLEADLGSSINTGVDGQTLDIVYASAGDTSTANAGTYKITGTLSSGIGAINDYAVTLIEGTLTVDKATANITVTPYNVMYDGNPHTATGTATGVESPNPANLSALLNLSGTTHTNPGSYNDIWTFAGNGNYLSASGTITDVISEPPLTISSIAAVTPNPRNSAVSSIDVTFNQPVNTSSLAAGALTLTDNNRPNLITAAVTLSLVSGTTSTYQVNGLAALTSANGEYSFAVNAADIQGAGGNFGSGSASTMWLMDTTPPTSTLNSLPTREATLTFPVTISASDAGNPASGLAFTTIYVSTNGGPWYFWTNLIAPATTANFTGQSNTTYSFYSVAEDYAGNVQNQAATVEASTYVPNLTPPVTSVNGTTGSNPSTVNTSTGLFTLNLTGTDPGGGLIEYFMVYVKIDNGTYQELGPYAIPAGAATNGTWTSSIAYQGLTDGLSHTYSFYSVAVDSNGNQQSAPSAPNVTFANQVFAVPAALAVSSFTVEHGSPGRSYIQYLDIGFNETGSALTSIVNSINTSTPLIQVYKYDLNDDASSKAAVPLNTAPTILDVIDHAIEINFGSNGIGGAPTSTTPDGYYEVDIKLPNGQTSVHHFYRLLGDVDGDQIVDQNDLNAVAASIAESAPAGWAPLSADVTGGGTVTALDLTVATRSKGHALKSGLPLG
jgi:Ca2+-binding RTX toxin-like protein